MSWNYRVVKQTVRYASHEEAFYGVHEAYYEDGHEREMPHSITREAVAPMAESPDELREMQRLILFAFDEPALEWNDFPDTHAGHLHRRSTHEIGKS